MEEIIFLYHGLIAKTWNRMVKLVGVHTVMILTKRALWLTSQKYSEADLISFNEEGICFHNLSEITDPQRMKAVLEEFFSSLIDILTRLVGRDMTRKLAEEIDILLQGKAEDNE